MSGLNKNIDKVVIDSSCINCDMCVPECPSDSIAFPVDEQGNKGKHYQINNDTCILCEDYYPTPNCIDVCPIGSVELTKYSQ